MPLSPGHANPVGYVRARPAGPGYAVPTGYGRAEPADGSARPHALAGPVARAAPAAAAAPASPELLDLAQLVAYVQVRSLQSQDLLTTDAKPGHSEERFRRSGNRTRMVTVTPG
jgi:hypothetical protein